MIKSRRLRWPSPVARMVGGTRVFKVLTNKPTEKGSEGRPRCRWENNIIMDLKQIYISTRNWVHSAQIRDYWRDLVNFNR